MEFSIVENLSGLQESIFNLSRGPQVHFGEKSKNCRILLNLPIFPLSPCLGSLGLLSFHVHLHTCLQLQQLEQQNASTQKDLGLNPLDGSMLPLRPQKLSNGI